MGSLSEKGVSNSDSVRMLLNDGRSTRNTKTKIRTPSLQMYVWSVWLCSNSLPMFTSMVAMHIFTHFVFHVQGWHCIYLHISYSTCKGGIEENAMVKLLFSIGKEPGHRMFISEVDSCIRVHKDTQCGWRVENVATTLTASCGSCS